MQWTRTCYRRAVGKWFQLIHPARDHRINSSTLSDLSHSITRRRTIHLRKTSLGFYSGRDNGHVCARVKPRTTVAENRQTDEGVRWITPVTIRPQIWLLSRALLSICVGILCDSLWYNSSTVFSKCHLYQQQHTFIATLNCIAHQWLNNRLEMLIHSSVKLFCYNAPIIL